MTTIPELLRRISEERKVKPNQLASYMDAGSSAMSRWINGISAPEPKFCWRIAKLAGMEIEDVMRIAGHLPPSDGPMARQPIDPQVLELIEPLSLEDQRRIILPAIEYALAMRRSGLRGER